MTLANCIVLYNPISNEGHLDSWHALFIESFLDSGWAVIAITSNRKGLEDRLRQKNLTESADLTVVDMVSLSDRRSGLRQLVDSCIQRLKKGRCWAVLRKTQGLFNQLKSPERQQQISDLKTHLSPVLFQKHINRLLEQRSANVNIIFNMYIDAYSITPSSWSHFKFSQPIPWASLCITSTDDQQDPHKPTPSYYTLSTYRGTCFLNDRVAQLYKIRWPNKTFECLPDITETALPLTATPIATRLEELAHGRTIVFMGGSIGRQKNLPHWFELIQKADSATFYFVQIGRINYNNLSDEDTAALSCVMSRPPENLYIYDQYIPDETIFNEIIWISDIIFAVYTDFARSSNMLSKAAYFEKPILVAQGALMAERVDKYGIGKSVLPNNTAQIHEGLLECLQLPDLPARFALYRADFNHKELKVKLQSFIQACLSSAPIT
jgi:hypothetical protein